MAPAPRTKQTRKGSPIPYLFHFGMFVGTFFALIGGALFVINISGSLGG